MNLDQSNQFSAKLQARENHKKMLVFSLIICLLLIGALIFLIMYINAKDARTEKVYLNGSQLKSVKLSSFYLIVDTSGNVASLDDKSAFSETKGGDKKVYISMTELADFLGYKFYQGSFELSNQDAEAGYFENDFEKITFSKDDDYYRKYTNFTEGTHTIGGVNVTADFSDSDYEEFIVENPIRLINNEFYVALDDAIDMFNINIEWKQYRKYLTTLDSLAKTNITKVTKATGSSKVSGSYENMKTILYGECVISDGSNYGVVDFKGNSIITTRYSKILFLQNAQQFYVESSDSGKVKVGLININGSNVVQLGDYDSLKLIDSRHNLYLVTKNGNYGVVDGKGQKIVYTDYDSIGYDISKYIQYGLDASNNSEYILNGKAIAVKDSDKYGLVSLESEGDLILNCAYDSFGYNTSAKREESSVLIIPEEEIGINCLIVSQNGLYGLYDLDNEKLATPVIYTKIYSQTSKGVKTYFAEYNDSAIELKTVVNEYMTANNLSKNTTKTDSSSSTDDSKSNSSSSSKTNTQVTDAVEDTVTNE